MTERLSCDGCAMCCNLMSIEDMPGGVKPRCVTCKHVEGGLDSRNARCGIYDSRPQSCKDFECVWLASQATDHAWPKKMRPDLCGVMFVATADPNVVAAHAQDARWFNERPAVQWISRWLTAGLRVLKVHGEKRSMLLIKEGKRLDV